jgi:type II restriction enzyme
LRVLTEQAIVPRKPLSVNARRAGWVGCNIDLTKIAPNTRVHVVEQGTAHSRQSVADRYADLKPLQSIRVKQRGWVLAVLNGIQSLGQREFTTQDAYQMESKMVDIFPDNKNVRPKIRQQLQVLRDLGMVNHLERGRWILLPSSSRPTNPQTDETNGP